MEKLGIFVNGRSDKRGIRWKNTGGCSGLGKWSLSRVMSSLEYLGIRQNVGHTRFVIERIAAINARELVLKPHSANAITRSSNIAITQQRNIGKCG